MTIETAIQVALKNSNTKEIGGFTKAFRSDDLGNILAGEEFVIPENYVVLSDRMMRDGAPVVDNNGNPVTTEYIKCQTTQGRIVNFYPSSLTKIAFAVDENGKDLKGADRIVRTKGKLVEYAKANPDINATMQALKGCTVKCVSLTPVRVRQFGVSNEQATKENVRTNNIGEWDLVGEKKPANWM
jgi:hypothetical protein